MTDTVAMEFRKKVGVFWPEQLYEECFKQGKPDPKQVTVPDKVRGIILPSSMGFEDGCTEIVNKREKSANKVSEIYTPDGALRDGQGADIWKEAQAAAKGKAASSSNGEGPDSTFVSLKVAGSKASACGRQSVRCSFTAFSPQLLGGVRALVCQRSACEDPQGRSFEV